MASTNTQDENISGQLETIDRLLKKRSIEWTDEDLETHGSKAELRGWRDRLLSLQNTRLKISLVTEERAHSIKAPELTLAHQGDAPEIIESGSFFRIPKLYSSHIRKSFNSDLILFKRTGLINEIKFLTERVVENAMIGWVVGPPGTGKSVAAFTFARSLASQGWRSTWLKFGDVRVTIIQFHQSQWWKGQVWFSNFEEFIRKMDEPGKDEILFIDGVRANDANSTKAIHCGDSWRSLEGQGGRGKRRIAIISSMSVRKIKPHEDEDAGIEGFTVESWSLEEFQSALTNEDLWNLVSANFDADIEGSKLDRVVAKHFFAGGSARFMFERTTAQVKEALDIAVSTTDDISKYLGGVVGDASGSVVNTLLGSHRDSLGKRYSFITSQYAALELSIKCGPENIKAISAAMQPYYNPAISGWLFEMLFMARISRGQLTLADAKKKVVVSCLVPTSLLQSSSPAITDIFQGDEKWIRPSNWNQAGFDAVHVLPESQRIEFFQITMAAKHDLNFDHFSKFISNIPKQYQAHIYFVLPLNDLNRNHFQIIYKGNQALNCKGWSSKTKHVSILGMANI